MILGRTNNSVISVLCRRNNHRNTISATIYPLQLLQQPSTSSQSSITRHQFSSTTPTPNDNKPVFQSIGVAGLGLMGHGITQVSAFSPTQKIIAYEPQQKFLDSGRFRIESSVMKLVSKELISQNDADSALSKIHYTTNADDFSGVDFVVEAVIENLDLKKKLYTTLGSVCKPTTIFASNTSSLSITELANLSDRPEKFVGVHFFNPVQIMKLVEVIRTEHTSDETFDKTFDWVLSLPKKVAVKCGDTPGFIVNRLLIPSLIQAMLMLDRGDATIRDIDISMKLGTGVPMGPLRLADYVGLDTCYYIVEGWTQNYPNEAAFVLPKCLKEKVQNGELGRKSGKGFYHWDGDRCLDPVQ